MRKVFFAVMFAGITAMCANAQMFVGGSLGLGFTADKKINNGTTNLDPSDFGFDISPMAGFNLSDNLVLGAQASLGFGVTSNRADTPTKDKLFVWGFSPFVRNTLVGGEKLSLLLQSSIGIAGASTSTITGSTSNDGPKSFALALDVRPVLQYSLTDRLSLEASSNIVCLGFQSITTKPNPSNNNYKEKTTG
ncbi:MAG: hypothetical protein LBV26_06240, partial [Bacteroidales bacterium]|nr:hypothetical protein [Bacteroidales bacterium]